ARWGPLHSHVRRGDEIDGRLDIHLGYHGDEWRRFGHGDARLPLGWRRRGRRRPGPVAPSAAPAPPTATARPRVGGDLAHDRRWLGGIVAQALMRKTPEGDAEAGRHLAHRVHAAVLR